MTDNLVYVRRKPVNSVKSGANGSVPPTSTFAKSAGVDQQASGVTATDVFANNRFIISHGKCHFWKNYAYSAEGHPYLKVSHDVRIEDIAYIMHRQWRMESPRIVALIISNVAPLQDWTNARQIAAFKKGLMKAANSTNMWIFTNGVNMGAARLIGDAVEQAIKESKAYRSSSSAANTTGHIPDVNVVGIMREDHLRYGENIDGETVNLQNEGNLMDEQKYELNDNHSHYLVVRDNTVSKTGINLFALRIIQYLSTIGGRGEFSIDLLDQSGRTSPDDYVPTIADLCSLTNTEIPIVSIVIQGGYDCARLVLEHLKRQQPVVVLRGSGGLADLLAFAYLEAQQRCRELADTLDAEYVESFLKPELSNKIVNRFPRLRDNTLARNIFRDRILECVRLARQCGCVYLSVLNMHNSACNLDNLSEYLLLALFQSRHGRHQQQPSLSNTDILLTDLYLTLDWNCPHVAATEVIGRDPSCVLRLEKAMFEQALTRADREEFVDLFMTNGFRVHKFLTPKRLRNLFKRIHRHEFFRSVCWEGVLGHSYDTDLNKEFVDIDLNWLIESCTDLRHFVQSQTLALNVMGMYATTTAAPDPAADMASAERKALFILTMWAVFGNRQKLAKVLWKHCDQPIHLGLIVSMMLERLSWFVGEQNLKTELKDPSKLFADYAIGALDLCFSRDESRANDALSEAPVEWNCKTAVDIAANARLRTFLAHPCCQKWLTNTFLGNIRLREMSWGFFSMPPSVKILLSALLVFPMYVWVRFWPKTGKQTVRDDKTEDQEDERDAMDEELHLINAQAAAGDGQKPSVGFVAALIPVPMGGALKGADDLLNKTGDELAKQGRHYQTVIKHRELLIRKQPPLFTMIYDMWNAPITKFWMFNLFYIIFLVLFSLALVWPSCGNYYLDSTVCAWTVLILVEHIRRTFVLYRKYTSVPIVFKCMEIVAIIVFVVIYASGRVFDRRIFGYYTMKVMLSFALIYFYYRLFDVHLPISPTLGPLLYRLKLMITVDFVNFMRMSALVICSSGVVIQAVLFPDEQLNLKMFRKLFHRAFFTLFNTPTDEIKGLCAIFGFL
ncbi:unnamed protein product [Medioppia subpectinata]|uniref:TRPM SLOG domain-containing protein n=1 Tax=Medioppia subpectinata TaxID=1979941 RepID=A0A7R9KI03_9ACAR|nr:unnamed protein product [Medioppia subpectinata]CAG2103874.1 unnamed protein product [Medioppia subpectinata]